MSGDQNAWGAEMRYRLDDKRAYRNLCRRYNRALHDLKGVSTNPSDDEQAMNLFTVLSILLHAAKARVPIKWVSLGSLEIVGWRDDTM